MITCDMAENGSGIERVYYLRFQQHILKVFFLCVCAKLKATSSEINIMLYVMCTCQLSLFSKGKSLFCTVFDFVAHMRLVIKE
jgi:hypothetical protein